MSSIKNAFFAHDIPAFQRLKSSGELKAAGERILAMLGSKGFQIVKHDTAGIKLMIAVPSADGRYDGICMRSVIAMQEAVRKFGGEVVISYQEETSDIAFARIKMFGAFRNSDCTHMLWWDSDQGVMAGDILKLLSYKVDFVAVAVIRKTPQPSFAVGSQDEKGNPFPIRIDPETGLLEPTRVGFACCVVTQAWASRMAQSYADLEFVTADGKTEVGIFMPMLVNRHYLAEDFAACYRWRQIGGRVLIDGSISVDHRGPFVWRGSWLDHLNEMEKARQQAA